jgi:hypothetical protein
MVTKMQKTVELTESQARFIKKTLKRALDVFQNTCDCNECYNCTNGQTDLEVSIETLQKIIG